MTVCCRRSNKKQRTGRSPSACVTTCGWGDEWVQVMFWKHNMIICWPWQPFIKDPAVRYWLYWRDRAPQQAAAGAGTRNSVIPDKMIVAQPAKQFSARTVPQGSYETGACSFPEPHALNAPRAIHPVCLCSSFYIWVFQVVHLFRNGLCLHKVTAELMLLHVVKYILTTIFYFNLLKSSGHVMHRQFNIQQLYVLPTLYLCVLYLSENKQRLVPLTA